MAVAMMLYANMTIPRKIITPEKNRTVHTGLSATTVSMNGMDGLFHCHPC
jgi:hypothetical protein